MSANSNGLVATFTNAASRFFETLFRNVFDKNVMITKEEEAILADYFSKANSCGNSSGMVQPPGLVRSSSSESSLDSSSSDEQLLSSIVHLSPSSPARTIFGPYWEKKRPKKDIAVDEESASEAENDEASSTHSSSCKQLQGDREEQKIMSSITPSSRSHHGTSVRRQLFPTYNHCVDEDVVPLTCRLKTCSLTLKVVSDVSIKSLSTCSSSSTRCTRTYPRSSLREKSHSSSNRRLAISFNQEVQIAEFKKEDLSKLTTTNAWLLRFQ